jgi:ABC-type phosphate transport system substrate-binding protein
MRIWILTFFAALSFLVSLNRSLASIGSVQVIVNSENPIHTMDRKFLSEVFLKKMTRWSDDTAIQPVDLEPESPVREEFSQRILKRSVQAVRNYWQRLLFSGRNIPPPELKSDDEVIRFVSESKGGIGYVSSSATVRGGIKVINIK